MQLTLFSTYDVSVFDSFDELKYSVRFCSRGDALDFLSSIIASDGWFALLEISTTDPCIYDVFCFEYKNGSWFEDEKEDLKLRNSVEEYLNHCGSRSDSNMTYNERLQKEFSK